MCLCHQAVYFGTSQGAVLPCGWEASGRSGIALAMCQSCDNDNDFIGMAASRLD